MAVQQAASGNGVDVQSRFEARREARRLVKVEQLKDAIGALTNERDAANKRANDLQAAFDAFKAENDKEPLRKKVAELQQKLRTTEHRRTFDEIAKEQGVNVKALDDLWEKSGWKAEGDEIDEDSMVEAIEAQKAERPYLFGTGEAKPDDAPVKPAPGSGGGARKRSPQYPAEAIPMSDARMSDPVWQMLNQDKLILSAQTKIKHGIEEQV